MKYLSAIVLVVMFSFSAVAADNSPHEAMTNVTGVINGTLLENKKPITNHLVNLEILEGHQLVLSIPKKTDMKGGYSFKNIFRSKDFSYSISTEYSGKLYRTDFISLGKDEEVRKLNLFVGAGAESGPSLPPPEMGGEIKGGHEDVHKKPINEYYVLTVLLTLCGIGYAIWQRKKCG